MDYRAIAAELLAAEANCRPIEPLTGTYPDLTVEDAYRIQLAGIETKLARGSKVIGKKIGLTSKGMQQLLGVNEPDYGHLLDSMLLLEGEPCRREELLWPRVEGELAFILKDPLKGPGVTIADVYRATEGIMPAFEIVDSRIRDWKIKLPDTIADNASSARLVLGSRMVPIKDLDLRLIGMVLEKNGEMVSSGAGAAVWGHPAAAVAWLANKLAAFDIALEAGEIILSGAVTAAENASAGDVFTVSFYGLGSLSLKFI
ncbi:2-keto-4-pentenoate hydratase [Moorella thermoacetica]|uniref:2-hydroxyhexa-2,4-dienoate hydratase n=4 Tax=Neomoorella thermoacetica TaxID=1525 RepID=A0AAC9MSZ5_NEOTH|nr:fumarylacetoacetate hydrolase family protein [Moorella thermoacetica]AKX94583.1 2-hydroxyhexa-2,4-dienoate hydratase [Moorella thermoacetica]AKX97219.1 2-hydroxyhexa-2,4-dienoate hydratase [Moorella thermoacetica]AOQ22903.1 2-hydroxyhexa-2,4-dienoate hydratase [Moorella thermoacetica]AOQ24524.1 2-hydroxyhexa-2,4-dienoate hydratase [Moorella thermoacetica]OIQ57362.1 2-hydroxyhexa-2,4-dienoate hydratase [Moorella thermoacetica]